MGFSRHEYCSQVPCRPPEDLPYAVIKPTSLASAGGFFTTSATCEASLGVHSAVLQSNSVYCCIQKVFLKGLPTLLRQFTYSNSRHSILFTDLINVRKKACGSPFLTERGYKVTTKWESEVENVASLTEGMK